MTQRLRFNFVDGLLGTELLASTSGTVQTITNLFTVAPPFPTLSSEQEITISLDPNLAGNQEIIHLIEYTEGSLNGTIIRGAESPFNAPSHAAGTGIWTHDPTADDFPDISSIAAYNVTAVANTDLSLFGSTFVDGIDVGTLPGLLVLATAQIDQTQNGPWITGPLSWQRPDWYSEGDTVSNLLIAVMNGTVYGGTVWTVNMPTIIVGTSDTTWINCSLNGAVAGGSLGGTYPNPTLKLLLPQQAPITASEYALPSTMSAYWPVNATSNPVTIALPELNSEVAGIMGLFARQDLTSNQVKIVPSGSDSFDDGSSQKLLLAQGAILFIIGEYTDGTGIWRVISHPQANTTFGSFFHIQPTIAAGSTIGTGGSPSVILNPFSTDLAGSIELTTGDSGFGGADLCDITFGNPGPNAPATIIVTGGDVVSQQIFPYPNEGYITRTGFRISAATGLEVTANTNYDFSYIVIPNTFDT